MIQLTYIGKDSKFTHIMLNQVHSQVLQGVQTLNTIVDHKSLTTQLVHGEPLSALYDMLSFFFVFNIVTQQLERTKALC